MTSCESSDKKMYNAAVDFITAQNIELDSVNNVNYSDSIVSVFNDSICIGQGINVWNHLQTLRVALNEFKDLYSDTIPRVWLKTIAGKEKALYDQVQNNYSNTFEAYKKLLSTVRNFSDKTNVALKVMNMSYRIGNKYYMGIFYFDINDNLIKSYLLDESQYEDVKEIITLAQNEVSNSYWGSTKGAWIPNYETAGIDIVPVDEDPTKTKEERAEIKRLLEEQERIKIEQEKIKKEKAIDNKIISDLKSFIRHWNQGGAKQVDYMTIAERASFKNPNIYYYFKMIVDKDEFSDYQWRAMESTMNSNLKDECNNVLQYFVTNGGLSRYEVKDAFKRIGLNWTYTYKDMYGRTLMTINITADDLN